MNIERVPLDLRERLGDGATASLIEVLDDVKTGCASEVMGMVRDRFERRLIEETSALRIEMSRGFAAVRQEIVEGRAALRQEMAAGQAALRQEMVEGQAALRQEMAAGQAALRQDMTVGFATLREQLIEGLGAVRQELALTRSDLRQEMAHGRGELLRWAFLFWVGQFFAMASLVAFLVQFLRPAG